MFNLQLFGENDTLSTEQILTMSYERTIDDGVQSIKLPNAYNGNNETTIRSAMQYALDNKIFLSSKDGVVLDTDTAAVFTAYRTNRSTYEYDLS